MAPRDVFYSILGLMGALISGGLWALFSHGFRSINNAGGLIVFLLLPLLFVIPHTLARRLPLTLVKFLGRLGGYMFFYVYYGLLILIPWIILRISFFFKALAPYKESALSMYAGGAAFLLFLILARGIWDGHHPIVRRVKVETEKSVNDFTIAFVSDIHLGPHIGKNFAMQMVRRINHLKPDLVLIGGDIIDGDLNTVLREKSLEGLARFKAPLGTYAVFGNHDHYGQNLRLEGTILQEEGISILHGESEELPNGAVLTGVMDYSYHPDDSFESFPGKFHIVLEHEPVHMKDAARKGADLFLAGHTHGGQFWPNSHFVGKHFPFYFGTKKYGNLTAIVTSGYGAWGACFRNGHKPEIVLIEVNGRMKIE